MNGDNFSYLLMFYLLGAVFLTVPSRIYVLIATRRPQMFKIYHG